MEEKAPSAIAKTGDYAIAIAMLQYLSISSAGLTDDIFHTDNDWDVSQCRKVFEKIFELTGQHQHFVMMMREYR